jgi:hypothetical protein
MQRRRARLRRGGGRNGLTLSPGLEQDTEDAIRTNNGLVVDAVLQFLIAIVAGAERHLLSKLAQRQLAFEQRVTQGRIVRLDEQARWRFWGGRGLGEGGSFRRHTPIGHAELQFWVSGPLRNQRGSQGVAHG